MGGAIKHFLKKLLGHENLGLWSPGLRNFFEKIVKPSTLQAIVLNTKESEAKYKLTVDNNDIESTKSVKLFGRTIDGRFRFDQNIQFMFQSCNEIKCFRLTSEIYGNI